MKKNRQIQIHWIQTLLFFSLHLNLHHYFLEYFFVVFLEQMMAF